MIPAVVCSKDRAFQCDALLRSLFRNCLDPEHVALHVVFKASSEAHAASYRTLVRDYPEVSFHEERDFRADVFRAVEGAKHVLFLVDDTIFVRMFSIAHVLHALGDHPDAIGFSLRMGRNTVYSYATARDNIVPPFEEHAGYLQYTWTTADRDFSYPLEISSSVYGRDVIDLLPSLAFSHPNGLEGALATSGCDALRATKPALLCFPLSVAFSAPMNRVQDHAANRSATSADTSAEALLLAFDRGERFDVEAYDGFTPNSCHQEIEMRFQ